MTQSQDTNTAIGYLQAALAVADERAEYLLGAAIANALAIAERTALSEEPHRWSVSATRN